MLTSVYETLKHLLSISILLLSLFFKFEHTVNLFTFQSVQFILIILILSIK